MRRISLPALALAGSAMFLLAGCGSSPQPPALAPEKPLGTAEQTLLKQIQDTPAPTRQAFMAQHRMEIMQFSSQNRAFGQRLDAILKS